MTSLNVTAVLEEELKKNVLMDRIEEPMRADRLPFILQMDEGTLKILCEVILHNSHFMKNIESLQSNLTLIKLLNIHLRMIIKQNIDRTEVRMTVDM